MTGYTRNKLEAEIRACKALLKETDGQVIEALEGLLNCTSATAIAAYLKGLDKETFSVVAKRQEYRETIQQIGRAHV